MNRSINLHINIFIIFLTFSSAISQPKKDDPGTSNFVLKQDFTPLLDSLIMPPSNCEEAFSMMIVDTAVKEYVINPALQEQEDRIQDIITELTDNANKNGMNRSGKPPVSDGPPGQNGPPGGMIPRENIGDIQDEFLKMKDDIFDAHTALDKITVEKEKFKDDLSSMQTEVNEKLHKTLESDESARQLIINDFLKKGVNKFRNYKRIFREKMLILDGIVKKYDYGKKVKTFPLRSEIRDLQLEEANVVKMMIKVTREFINIGVKYHV